MKVKWIKVKTRLLRRKLIDFLMILINFKYKKMNIKWLEDSHLWNPEKK